MPYNIAVIGATGNVGRELLGMLAERDFPVSNIDALASSESIGEGGVLLAILLRFELPKDLAHNFDFSSSDNSSLPALERRFRLAVLPSLSRSCPLVIDEIHRRLPHA